MILGVTPHSCSEPDFRIPAEVFCWGAPFAIFFIDSQPTVRRVTRLSWNFVEWYQTPILTIEPNGAGFFDFLPGRAVRTRLWKISDWFTAYNIYSIKTELGRIILDITLHNRSQPEFFRFSFKEHCGRASCNPRIDSLPTVIILLDHDWAETC